jgi:hypothetical protein
MIDENGSLGTPCPGDIANGISAPTENDQGPIKRFYKVDASGVALAREIEDAETVAGEGVGATL